MPCWPFCQISRSASAININDSKNTTKKFCTYSHRSSENIADVSIHAKDNTCSQDGNEIYTLDAYRSNENNIPLATEEDDVPVKAPVPKMIFNSAIRNEINPRKVSTFADANTITDSCTKD